MHLENIFIYFFMTLFMTLYSAILVNFIELKQNTSFVTTSVMDTSDNQDNRRGTWNGTVQ